MITTGMAAQSAEPFTGVLTPHLSDGFSGVWRAVLKLKCRLPITNRVGKLLSMSRQLSQQEIDAIFQASPAHHAQATAVAFDFRRPDRIPKSQIRAIQLLHDTFVRNLVSSLSVYLRSYLTVNLVSVEQLSYAEFLDALASPTCIVPLGCSPDDVSGSM